MAKGRESFDRRQRERAKKAKADAKRQRRLTKDDEGGEGEGEETAPAAPVVDEEKVLAQLAKLHEAFEAERIGFDEFEEQRTELLARLQID
jgi:hypothetical protein